MTYRLKIHGTWKTSYWKPEISSSRYTSSIDNEYSDLSEELFKTMLNEELDIPEYDITEENISREFGYTANGMSIPARCVDNIIKYYAWRKALFEKICKAVLGGAAEQCMDKAGCDELSFKYMLPAEYNNFSCEDPDYDSGQVDAFIEVGVSR